MIARQAGWLLPALLALVTFVAFLPTLGNGFVDWDDDVNLLSNPDYRGLGWPQLRWMLTTFWPGHYIPLTWFTFGLDYVLWGMNPAGYHLTSLMLHMANGLVFYAIAVRLLTAALPILKDSIAGKLGGALAALLFAVHPLRVESVAWATERRDVLSGLFYLLAVFAYLKACTRAAAGSVWRAGWYWGAVGLGAMALLSKSMAVSLPAVLLLLDVYPLGRLGRGQQGWAGPIARRVYAEKIPFVALSLAASVMALVALDHVKGIRSIAELSMADRLAISVYSLAFYLWKMVVPVNLSPLYELPARIEPLSWPYVAAGVAVIAVSAGAFLSRRRWPALAAAWLSYVIILLPVLGIVPNGWQIAADRYTYLAEAGWALLAGAIAGAWLAAGVRRRRALVVAGAWLVSALILGALTWRQVSVWHDTRSLWTHALETRPSAIAHSGLGTVIVRQGDLAEALRHFRLAVAIKPDYPEAHNNLGSALARQDRFDEAVQQFREAVIISPNFAQARSNLGRALSQQGRLDEAAQHLRMALRLRPNDSEAGRVLEQIAAAEAHSNLGRALYAQGDRAEAVWHFRRALAINPNYAEAHYNLGVVLDRQAKGSEAGEHLRRALSIRPELREARTNVDGMLVENRAPLP